MLKTMSMKKCYENKEIINKEIPNFGEFSESDNNLNIKNQLISGCDKIIDLIPLKSNPDLFINYNIVQIDENGLCNYDKSNSNNKVIFKVIPENYSPKTPSQDHFLSSDNDKNIGKNDVEIENKDDTIFITNKIDQNINKSITLFSVQYNKKINRYILTSLTDEIYFTLEIWSNKKMYLSNLKRYYVQLSDVVLSIFPNNIDKNITIKILSLNSEEKNKNKYFFDSKNLSIKIGRNDCNININKNSISKVHLIIDYDNIVNKYYIKDNYSTNGSLIILKKGKEIELKDKMFFFLVKQLFTLRR